MSKENTTNDQEITPEAYEALKGELEAAKTTATQQVALATQPLKERIAALETEVGSKSQDMDVLKTKLSDSEKGFASLTSNFEGAVSAYKAAALKANPLIPAELVSGATIAEIDASVDKAIAIVGKIKEGLGKETQTVTVPAGAPGRTPPDLSAMTTKEKINHGINARRKGG